MESPRLSENWQAERSLVECNRYMLEHEMSDVTFTIHYKDAEGESGTVQIRALKTLLLARSSVFYAMFCGGLQEQRATIDVTDVDPDAFREIIRYIYTDEVELSADNVLAILYASKKYMVSSLTKKCTKYMEETLNVDTALTLLEQSIFFDEKELIAKCIEKTQAEASTILASEGFVDISQAALHEFLNGKIMAASELEVLNACVRWARKQCRDKDIDANAANLRAVLGDDLFLIRFPALTTQEFNEHVAPLKMLTFEEGYLVLRYLTHKVKESNFMFTSECRSNPYVPHTLVFDGPYNNVQCRYNYSITTTLKCKTSKSIKLSKVLVHGGPHTTGNLRINLEQNGNVIATSSNANKVNANEDVPVNWAVIFSDPVAITSGTFDISVAFKIPFQRSGSYGMQGTSDQITQLSDNIIVIDFEKVSENFMLGIEYALPK